MYIGLSMFTGHYLDQAIKYKLWLLCVCFHSAYHKYMLFVVLLARVMVKKAKVGYVL